MLRRDVSICSLVLVLSLCLIPSLHAKEIDSIPNGGGWRWESSYPRELRDPLASLYLHLMTRPGITAESDVKLLIPVTHEAAACFRKSLFQGSTGILKQARFTKEVHSLDQAYLKEYANAPEGIVGAEARGVALDRLLDGLLLSASRCGIPLEELDLALLRGAARVESRIEERPLSRKLSMEDRELVRLLLITTVSQFHPWIAMDETRNAFRRIGAGVEITGLYDDQIYKYVRSNLKLVFVGLEEFLSDPQTISDANNLIAIQFNYEAQKDLMMLFFSFKLSSLSHNLGPMIAGFASRIPAMTDDILSELGIIAGRFPITDLAAYYSVTPDKRLSYAPVSGLAGKLVALGGMPPTPPDLSSFSDPYLALFLLHYDIELCGLITSREWLNATNTIMDQYRVPSLNERLVLKEASMRRLSKVMAHLGGNRSDAYKVLVTLLSSSYGMRH
jgi:hypothetical protein